MANSVNPDEMSLLRCLLSQREHFKGLTLSCLKVTRLLDVFGARDFLLLLLYIFRIALAYLQQIKILPNVEVFFLCLFDYFCHFFQLC